MKKYLDYGGLKHFKECLEQVINKDKEITEAALDTLDERIQNISDELIFADDDDIDTVVLSGNEDSDSDEKRGIITLHNLAYYHKKLISSEEGISSVNNVILDALEVKIDEGGNEVKSDLYTKVESIVDSHMNEKMEWKTDFPE